MADKKTAALTARLENVESAAGKPEKVNKKKKGKKTETAADTTSATSTTG